MGNLTAAAELRRDSETSTAKVPRRTIDSITDDRLDLRRLPDYFDAGSFRQLQPLVRRRLSRSSANAYFTRTSLIDLEIAPARATTMYTPLEMSMGFQTTV